MKPIYKRFILKLSGEALAGKNGFGIGSEALISISKEIKEVWSMNCEICVVLGGGNIYRGSSRDASVIDKVNADYMGMLATVINGLALQNTLEKLGLETRVQSSFDMRQFCEPYIRRRAIRHLEKGRIIILVGGTGNPYFTTDTAAALKAVEVGAEAVLKATKVDGIYSADPFLDPNAKRYDRLTYSEALQKRLKIMDSSAISLCMENNIPVIVFNLFEKGNLQKVLMGKGKNTILSDTDSLK
ncbi:UMP kinase [bacterium]|jgi:uridylate kinase|nr:UMP kinase [bacterium]